MTLKRKKRFFHRNWFWCELNGIFGDNLNRLTGDFARYSKKCEVFLYGSNK